MEYSAIEKVCEKFGAEYFRNERLSKYTSFEIGGECDVLVKPNNSDCLIELLKACRKNDIPYHILGKGTNVLVSDNGVKGVVIVISSAFSEISLRQDEVIYCDAGASLTRLCNFARDNSLTGLEFAYGIPGTVGGALFMNAGAYGGEIKDVVESCIYLDESLDIKEMSVEDMKLSYRHSIFSEKNYIVIGACFKLENGDKQEISEKMNEIMNKRREKQPLEYPSAGSTFKRPVGDFAGRLIEASGLKGYSCGGAEVSTKHSGFVINKGNATFDDVMNVINGVKEKVFKDSGIMLECEILVIE